MTWRALLVTLCIHPGASIKQLNHTLHVNPTFLSQGTKYLFFLADYCFVAICCFKLTERPVSENSSTNSVLSSFVSRCKRMGWAQPCWKAGDFPAPGSQRHIIKRLTASARILQSTMIVDGPIRHATVDKILANRISRVVLLALLKVSNRWQIWGVQMFPHGILSSFPCFRTEGASIHCSWSSREDSLLTYLRKLRKDGIFKDDTFQKILPSSSSPGVLYGLPKVHKSGCPFRPITILLPISYAFLNLSPLTVKDSFSFAEWAKSYNHNNEFLCSFEVSSLFTNVPLDETIQISLDKMYTLPNPPKLPRTVLKDLLVFATRRSHFVFDGQYYDQVDGVAMGSPLGPVLANIFMCHFEEKWVMNNSDRPSVWFRYVDDTFYFYLISQ